MNIIQKRFPHVIQNILNNLDNQSLNRSKEAIREIAKCTKNEKFFSIRIIKRYTDHFRGFEESWKEVLYKIPLNLMRQLTDAVQHFFKYDSHTTIKVAPLHIVAEKGSLELCQYIITKTNNKNPQGKLQIKKTDGIPIKFYISKDQFNFNQKITPLHIAAINGNVDQFRVILDNVDDCNPTDYKGKTPFTVAAINGHLDLCRMIINKFEDKTPLDHLLGSDHLLGRTTLSLAAMNDNLDIFRLIIERVENVNPENILRDTPFHWAALNGNLDICRLILEKVNNKNPANITGWTPLHFAAINGSIDICRIIIENVNDKHPRNNTGETPKNFADKFNHVAISRLFEN